MQLIRIQTDDELLLYKKQWDDILATEKNDNPFIEFIWFYHWWRTVGRKERVELYAVEHEDSIIAFFPFTVRQQWGVRLYSFAGEGIANYAGIIAEQKWLYKAVVFVLDGLCKKYPHIAFSLHGLLESQLSVKLLEQYFVERQLHPHIFRVVTPYIALQEVDVPQYIEQRKKLHGVDRREKKLRRLGTFVKKKASENELWKMFQLFDRRWAKKLDTSGFTTKKKRAFFEQLAYEKEEALQIEIDTLVFEQQWLAFTYGIRCRGRYVLYTLAHEPTFQLFGVGRLLQQEVLRRTYIEAGQLFDMSIGYEPYKFDWHSGLDFTRHMLVSGTTKRAKWFIHCLAIKERLKTYAKSKQWLVNWKRNTLGQWYYLGKYGKWQDWLQYGQQLITKWFNIKQIDLYAIAPTVPCQPVGTLFEELTIQEAIELQQEEVIALLYQGYNVYTDAFTTKKSLMFAMHYKQLRIDAVKLIESLPPQTCFVTNEQGNVATITAFCRKIQPIHTIYMTASFWQWRKRKALVQLGYQRITRIRYIKCFRYQRKQLQHYSEHEGRSHAIQ
ncbi:GNAT family N-acetyltransferase [Lysinibacillus piscis]|uniref:BioF2-like acetyltransferase domain-containing protein n=1 Tax=Lysinibacillus piscis TaxID=2518931 RepID=A0ABQ5NN36_9BACI|nr:GNAT family N-acetyltransferase [Lysinibacillus sp. KH24]GLC89775.1 hypothetical protein LYSBPC_29020 [Lysinibacillus sp. KH24]